MSKLKSLSVFALGVSFTITSFAAGRASSLPPIQIVQTTPIATTLSDPELPDAKDVWVDMIKGATKTLDLGQFYVQNAPDSSLEPVLKEMEKAGARGVKIRMIVDHGMVSNDPATIARIKAIPNTELRILDLSKLTGGIIHAKYFVVDGAEIYMGSQNFDWKALTHIHETGVRVKDDKLAAQFTQIFEIDWEICRTGRAPTPPPAPPTASPGAMELVASPPQFLPAGIRPSLPALIELLNGAKSTIQFQVMTYSPTGSGGYWGAIDDALKRAAGRGVKVEFMIADWSIGEPIQGYLKKLASVPGIQIKIVSIPDMPSGCITYARVTHTKMMVIDGQTLWMGTSNWSQGYFTATRGAEIIFKDEGLAKMGQRIITRLWDSSYTTLIDPSKSYTQRKNDCK